MLIVVNWFMIIINDIKNWLLASYDGDVQNIYSENYNITTFAVYTL